MESKQYQNRNRNKINIKQYNETNSNTLDDNKN